MCVWQVSAKLCMCGRCRPSNVCGTCRPSSVCVAGVSQAMCVWQVSAKLCMCGRCRPSYVCVAGVSEAVYVWQVSAKLRSCCGRPGEMLCRIADELGATYVVTGHHRGGSGAGRIGAQPPWGSTGSPGVGVGAGLALLLGSVSDYLLRHARCPVVVCRAATDPPTATAVGRRLRRQSDGILGASKNRRRHQSAKDARSFLAGGDGGGGRGGRGGEGFASSLRRRFLSGGKESASMDAGGDGGKGQGVAEAP